MRAAALLAAAPGEQARVPDVLGSVRTHWRTGTRGSTSSTREAARTECLVSRG
jgi:hypothetical protein